MGLAILPVRAEGLAASRGATDFGEYFLYFSFFLVVSALLLASLFFKFGIEQRLREIGTLQAIGFPRSKIRNLFLAEGLVLSLVGSLLGLLGAVAYGYLILLGLRTWWVDAVGTTQLRLHVSPLSLLLGGIGGVLAAVICIAWTLRRLGKASSRSLFSGVVSASPRLRVSPSASWRLWISIALTALALLILVAATFQVISQTARFLRQRYAASRGIALFRVGLVAAAAAQNNSRKGLAGSLAAGIQKRRASTVAQRNVHCSDRDVRLHRRHCRSI